MLPSINKPLNSLVVIGIILLATIGPPVSANDAVRPTNMASYLASRSAALATETAADFQSDAPALNAREQLANAVLMAAKNATLVAGLAQPGQFGPARNFFDVAAQIHASQLFKIIRAMPKGGLLHGHDTGMASIDYLVQATYRDNLWQCTDPKTLRIVGLLFARTQPSSAATSVSPCPAPWTLTATERQKRGAVAFDAFMRTHFTLRTGYPFADINAVWNQFSGMFDLVGPLVTYAPVWGDYYRQALQEALADNVQYVEFRALLPSLYDLDGKVNANLVSIAQVYVDVLAAFKQANPTFIGSKMIYAPLRQMPDQSFAQYVTDMTQLQAQFPGFVAGFDLVGQEDLGRSLLNVSQWLLQMPAAVKFYFHAGETDWFGGEADENLFDAITLGTQRIGHGFALSKHPTLLQLVKQRDIAIEVCPLSNQILMLVNDIRNHPAATFFAQNMPLVVSSDDPCFWEALPLSDDYYQAFVGVASAHADLRTLKKLAQNSIKYSAMSAAEQADAQQKWSVKWTAFVEQVIAGQF